MDPLLAPCLLLLVSLHAGYAIPSITPGHDSITVNSGQEIRLRCKDDAPVYWIFQKPLLSRKPKAVPSTPFQGNPNEQQLIVSKAQAKETGRYICINKDTSSNQSIYVFVKDSRTPFLSSISNSVDGEEGRSVIVMCPANDPTISDFTLKRCDGTSVPEAMTFIPDILQGIILKNLQKSFEGCYICSAKQDGQLKTSQQFSLNVKPVHKVIPIIFLSKNSQLLKQGEKFEVICTIRDVFSTVEGSWKNHPNMQVTSKSKYHADSSYELNLTLSRPSVEVNDSGIFTCQARNAVGMSHASIILNVIDGKQKEPQRGPSWRSLSPAPLVEELQLKKQRQKTGYQHLVQAKSQHPSTVKHSAPAANMKHTRNLSRKRLRAWMARLDNYMARQEENVASLENHLDHIIAMIGRVEERLNIALERVVSYK